MKFTGEQLEKAKDAKSAEELLALAKENGIELTGEEAAKYYAELHREGEIADDELDNVAGGCGDDGPSVPEPEYHGGETVYFCYEYMRYYEAIVLRTDYYNSALEDWRYWIYVKDTGEEKTTWGGCLYREI